MIQIFKTINGSLEELETPEDGCWIAMTDPTATEIMGVANRYEIEVDDLRAPLDEEERSRIQTEENYSLILVDIPVVEERNGKDWYVTIPMGIIIAEKAIITVCLEDTPVLGVFMDGRVRDFYTNMKTRFILQILYKNAGMYLHYLRIIDNKSDQIEAKMHRTQKNEELIEVLELEKCLVYFTTSLRSNETVLERLMKNENVKHYQEDEELLEDVIIENKQAIEMANIYSNILRDMADAFGSIISNNLNLVMKFLTTFTIVLSIPTMIFSAYGMNLKASSMPLSGHPQGFLLVCLFSLGVCLIASWIMAKKKLF